MPMSPPPATSRARACAPPARRAAAGLAAPLLALMVAGALAVPARAAEAPPAPPAATPEVEATTPGPGAKKKKKPARRVKKRRAPSATKEPDARPDPHKISDKARRITPFPQEEAAVEKAFAENRRDQISDAEKAARAPKQADRWHTVLFHVRELNSRTDPEGCFWRVLAYYRLGEITRARSIRQSCELAGQAWTVLDEEDAAAVSRQAPAPLPDVKVAGDLDREGRIKTETPQPADNPAPYTGPAPARTK